MAEIDEIALCIFCSKQATLKCSRCMFYYCSQECHTQDCQAHPIITLPSLSFVASTDIVSEQLYQLSIESSVDDETSKDAEQEQTDKIEQVNFDNETKTNTKELLPTITEVSEEEEEDQVLVIENNVVLVESGSGHSDDQNHDQALFTSRAPAQKPQLSGRGTRMEAAKENPMIIVQRNYFTAKKRTDKPIEYNDLKIHEWPSSKNVKVKIMSIVKRPYIICYREDKALIDEFYDYALKEVDRYYSSIKGSFQYYMPKLNEIVIGKFEGSWHRACILNASEDGIIVQFIDYGNLHILNPSEVLPINEKLSFEIFAREFIVENIPQELSEKQQEILDSESMMITNIHKDKRGIYHCDIFGF